MGGGPPVLLVHAGCADRRMWVHQMDALGRRYRAIRYDWRGYGESDDADAPVSRHADLLSVLDAVGEDRAVVVGASDGGRAALDAALTAPERITGLVLIGSGLSGYSWPTSMLQQYRDRVHVSIGVDRVQAYRTGLSTYIDPADLDIYSRAETEYLVAGPDRRVADLPPRVWELALAMDRRLNERAWRASPIAEIVLQPPAVDRLAEITMPTLVVNGLADVPEITQLGRILAGTIPRVRHLQLPGTGHLPALERPHLVNNAILRFLADQPSPRARLRR